MIRRVAALGQCLARLYLALFYIYDHPSANYYSPDCFGDQSPQDFFSEIISSRYRLHAIVAEPHGPGTGGTIVGILSMGNLISDIEKIIEDMISGLWVERYSEYKDWQKRWRSEEIE